MPGYALVYIHDCPCVKLPVYGSFICIHAIGLGKSIVAVSPHSCVWITVCLLDPLRVNHMLLLMLDLKIV